mmetsp:Transcript_33906/g.75175  ORF Transcript_33906/g.75175 Transcript_33906/m.75175 type:complete len:552 (+) Transcript_33906:101-1756(+)
MATQNRFAPLGQSGGYTTMETFPNFSADTLHCHELLSQEEQALRLRVREVMEKQVAPVIPKYWERAEFPFELLPVLRDLNVAGGPVKGYGCPGLSPMSFGMVMAEAARVDCSISTFLLAHGSLAMATLLHLGSDKHKQELLPGMAELRTLGAWALTEPDNGSDASGLRTTATRVPGGWRLDGRKRWIGNATVADVIIVWARNTESGQVNAFLVRKGAPGLRVVKMHHKLSHRLMQNGDVALEGVVVSEEDRLPGADSFQATAGILAWSRVMVAWQPVGVAAGLYDMAARYCRERKQFGAPLAAYQITQEKLVRMLSTTQAMWTLTWRLTRLYESGRMTPGMAGMVKAHNSLRGREVAALGRELLGSNGLLADFLAGKALADMEGIHSYEGTYEVNTLVAGREITGYAAFKAAGVRATGPGKQQQGQGQAGDSSAPMQSSMGMGWGGGPCQGCPCGAGGGTCSCGSTCSTCSKGSCGSDTCDKEGQNKAERAAQLGAAAVSSGGSSSRTQGCECPGQEPVASCRRGGNSACACTPCKQQAEQRRLGQARSKM